MADLFTSESGAGDKEVNSKQMNAFCYKILEEGKVIDN